MHTIAMTEVIDLIRVEAAQLQDFLAGLDQAVWSRPSACAGWTVGDVTAHLTQGARTWGAAIPRAMAGDATPPAGEQPLSPGERGSAATAQRAIASRQSMGEAELLRTFVHEYQHLHHVLLNVPDGDWDKPCYHRRGVLPTRDYVGIRLQELVIHGWDIRSAFDATATISETSQPVLLGLAQRWLANVFCSDPHLIAPLCYRFEVAGPVPLQQDVLVNQDGIQIASVTARNADVTLGCTTGDYILLVYGRLPIDWAANNGRLAITGNRQQASLFTTLFRGA